MAVTFDLFGTLVAADRPTDPGRAVAAELEARGVPVPDGWDSVYRERHVDAPPGAEVPLPAHVEAALESRGVEAPENAVSRAVRGAFDPAVETRPGARRAVEAAVERGSAGVLSNCAVPDLAGQTLARSALDRDAFDAVVASAGCGWRKPDRRAFEVVARRLDADPGRLVHVGDDPETDGGVEELGADATFVNVADVPLADLPAHLEDGCP